MVTNMLGRVFETLLCSPGMSEPVKIDVKVSRKVILLLDSAIERGLSGSGAEQESILEVIPKESLEELKVFSQECIAKAGLKELSEKLKTLQTK